MRKIMRAFDHSCIPVQPEIPFDLPQIPRLLATTSDAAATTPPKKPKTKSRKLKREELASVMRSSYNQDALMSQPQNEFAELYIRLEYESSSGRTVEETAETRCGRWLFIYCVLQSLPMTVVDAVGCMHKTGVEYFLCENLKGSLPWETKDNRRANRLSGIWMPSSRDLQALAGGEALPTHIPSDNELEYTYRRSHCWTAAEQWRMVSANESDAMESQSDTAFLAFQRNLLDGIRDGWSPDTSPTTFTPPGFDFSQSAIDGVMEQLRNYDQVPLSPQEMLSPVLLPPPAPLYAPPPPPRLVTGTTAPSEEDIPHTQEEFVKYRGEHFALFQASRNAPPTDVSPTRLNTEDPAGSPSLLAQPGRR
jgi:hypothetical protein